MLVFFYLMIMNGRDSQTTNTTNKNSDAKIQNFRNRSTRFSTSAASADIATRLKLAAILQK